MNEGEGEGKKKKERLEKVIERWIEKKEKEVGILLKKDDWIMELMRFKRNVKRK